MVVSSPGVALAAWLQAGGGLEAQVALYAAVGLFVTGNMLHLTLASGSTGTVGLILAAPVVAVNLLVCLTSAAWSLAALASGLPGSALTAAGMSALSGGLAVHHAKRLAPVIRRRGSSFKP
jgi:hypothetical protein